MMTREAKIAILNRALALEARTFLEYIVRTATPVDIEEFPEVERGLDEILAEEEAIVDALVDAIEVEGGALDLGAGSDMHYPYYNYVTTEYALKVIAEKLEERLVKLDAVVDEAAADAAVHELLRPIRDRHAAVLARVKESSHGLAVAAAKKKAPAHAAAPPKAEPHQAAH